MSNIADDLSDHIDKMEDRIKEMAIKYAGDYPGIADCEAWEQLYAIECALAGTNSANDSCHALIDVLRQRLGMTKEEVVDLWQREVESKERKL